MTGFITFHPISIFLSFLEELDKDVLEYRKTIHEILRIHRRRCSIDLMPCRLNALKLNAIIPFYIRQSHIRMFYGRHKKHPVFRKVNEQTDVKVNDQTKKLGYKKYLSIWKKYKMNIYNL